MSRIFYEFPDGPHFSHFHYLKNVMKEQFKPIPNDSIYVFGSNFSGIHGAGTAKLAFDRYGATWGQGFGPAARSFAIPTKGWDIESIPLDQIVPFVERFLDYVHYNPSDTFYLTKIGCGLAGFTEDEIRPLFEKRRYDNIIYPYGWDGVYTKTVYKTNHLVLPDKFSISGGECAGGIHFFFNQESADDYY